jgi:hypothetical protein
MREIGVDTICIVNNKKQKERSNAMATVKQAIKIFSYITGEQWSRVNLLARRLIDYDMIPKSTGRDVKQIDPGSAANLLFAIAFADTNAAAPTVAKKFMGIPCPANPGKRLGGVVASVLGGKLAARQIDFHRDSAGLFSATVRLILPDNEESLMHFHTGPSARAFVQRTFSINNLGLQQIQYILGREDLPEDIEFAGVKTMGKETD